MKSPAVLVRNINLSVVVILSLMVGFSLWYAPGDALSTAEREIYMQRLNETDPELRAFLDPEALDEFMAMDDGRAFFVINLFRFNDFVTISEGASQRISGREAFTRFTQAAVPFWLRFGTHPVLATGQSDTFSEDWDLVSVVRYRSRRDFMEIQTHSDYHAMLPFRLSATEENIRLKLPGTIVPPPILLLAVLSLLVFLGLMIWRLAGRNASTRAGAGNQKEDSAALETPG